MRRKQKNAYAIVFFWEKICDFFFIWYFFFKKFFLEKKELKYTLLRRLGLMLPHGFQKYLDI